MTNIFRNKKLASLAFKYRGGLWGLFALAALFFPSEYSLWRLLMALPLLFAGQALRFWAAGVIPKYRTLELDAPLLVIWGPYRWMRNPLYAGNALLGVGWSVMLGWHWVPIFLILFALLYSVTIIPYEESFLLKRFGAVYEEYRRRTPALIPRFPLPPVPTNALPYDAAQSWLMERHSLRMNLLVTFVLLCTFAPKSLFHL